ncbi:MAG: NRDE family protein [Marinicellaceae bacterium]
MCTITLLHSKDKKIITMNRDEHRSRFEANEIKKETCGQTEYYYPVDRLSLGTWFGFNNHGITIALLNRYQEKITEAKESRGMIIPSLLKMGSSANIQKVINLYRFEKHQPFDLVLSDKKATTLYSWDGDQISQKNHNTRRHLIKTSSSINLDFITQHRHQLFNQFVKKQNNINANNIFLDYHINQNKMDTSSSVFMSREHVHTKSICQVVLSNTELTYRYWSEADLQKHKNLERKPSKKIHIK